MYRLLCTMYCICTDYSILCTDYCAGIWGLGEFDKINHVLVQGIRAFLGAHRHIAKACLLSDMGWPLDTTRRKVEILRYWNRIHHLSDNRLTKKIFNWLYNGNSVWCRDACEVLTECEMLDVYRNNVMCNVGEANSFFMDNQFRRLETEILFKPKLRIYKELKDNFSQPEPYITSDINRKTRSLINQFRSGSLPLAIETGRWNNIEQELRFCKVCNKGTVKDEIHFIFQCEPLRFVREKHQQPLHCDFLNDDSQVTPTQLLKHFMSANTIKTFAKFLHELYDARRDTLYNS